jgi:hypothetical protein
MMDRTWVWCCLAGFVLQVGCTTANHGAFATATYVEPKAKIEHQLLGGVVGESRQTWFLYVLPVGEAPSTRAAIADAKAQLSGTRYLADMSVDDRTLWKVGYSEQVIRVEADAYR